MRSISSLFGPRSLIRRVTERGCSATPRDRNQSPTSSRPNDNELMIKRDIIVERDMKVSKRGRISLEISLQIKLTIRVHYLPRV